MPRYSHGGLDSYSWYESEWVNYGQHKGAHRTSRAFELPDGTKAHLAMFRCGHCGEPAQITVPVNEQRSATLCLDCWELTKMPDRPGVFPWRQCQRRHYVIGPDTLPCEMCAESEKARLAKEAEKKAEREAEEARVAAEREERRKADEHAAAVRAAQDAELKLNEDASKLAELAFTSLDGDTADKAKAAWDELDPELALKGIEIWQGREEARALDEKHRRRMETPRPFGLDFQAGLTRPFVKFILLYLASFGTAIGTAVASGPKTGAVTIILHAAMGAAATITALILNGRIYKWRKRRYDKAIGMDAEQKTRKELLAEQRALMKAKRKELKELGVLR